MTTSLANSASPLSTLRKKTGYSLSHCRAALQQFNDNLEQAEAWLHQRAQTEGWSRATKLQSRAASQGLVGIVSEAHSAAMVEVNCETDFVAKNDKFQQLVSQVAKSLLVNQKTSKAEKTHFDKDTLAKLKSADDQSKTLADLTALCVGSVGENVVLRRAVVLNLKENQILSTYCHGQINTSSSDACRMGKYGALVNYSQVQSTDETTPSPPVTTRSYPLRLIGSNDPSKPTELSRYFDDEDESNQLHEFLNGSVYALPSRDSAQDLLLKNISQQIERQGLKDMCVLPLDMRVQTPEPTYIYYPGLCFAQRAAKADQAVTRDPLGIIELVTPTTERLILHEKSLHYQRIPSLKQIIYLWPHLKMALVDLREDNTSKWTRTSFGVNDQIPLISASSTDGKLVLSEIFNNMIQQFGRLLAQHIVATRSRTLGLQEKKALGNDEDRLFHQKWLHTDDKKKTVEHFLAENQLTVNDFVRFECGEEL